MRALKLLLTSAVAVSLSACMATGGTGAHYATYSGGSAYTAASVYYGTVVGSRAVIIQDRNVLASGIVGAGGGAIGAILGSKIGGGSGKKIATIVGGIAGSMLAYSAANAVQDSVAVEVFFQLDGSPGVVRSVVQPGDYRNFYPNMRVMVTQGHGGWRVVPM